MWSAAWSRKLVKLFINKITCTYYQLEPQSDSGLDPGRHCKLRKFINIFTHFARPSTQRHMPSFGLRCTKMRLVAGLCPDRLGELTALPRPPCCIWGMRKGRVKIDRGKDQGKGKGGWGKGQVWREGWGEERGRDSDMERDECDPLDNSPMWQVWFHYLCFTGDNRWHEIK